MPEAELSKGEGKSGAAYLPFRTFLSSFDVFDHGIPHQVDRSLWRSQSGVIQSQILIALRFFRLIDDNDLPRPALERFVANKDKRKEYVGALLQHSYKAILDRDLTKMTPKLLADEMDAYGLTGETKRKATAFFLQAARFAELPMHPLLQAQTRVPSSPASRKKRKAPPSSNDRHPAGEPFQQNPPPPVEPSGGETKTVVLKSGALISLKVSANWLELPSDERKFVFELIDLLQSSSVTTPKAGGGAS